MSLPDTTLAILDENVYAEVSQIQKGIQSLNISAILPVKTVFKPVKTGGPAKGLFNSRSSDSGKSSSCSPVLLDSSFDSGIAGVLLDSNDMQLHKRIQQCQCILLALERDQEYFLTIRNRLSKIINKKQKQTHENEFFCNVCCAEVDANDEKTYVKCYICKKYICRNIKCSNWLPKTAEWECDLCQTSKESLAQTSSWVADQITYNEEKLTCPPRARSEVYIPISEYNDNFIHFESVSQIGANSNAITAQQKLIIRQYVEEVVAKLLGGNLDTIAVNQLSKSENYLLDSETKNIHNGTSQGSVGVRANGHDFSDISEVRLRQMIEKIIAETISLTPLKNGNGVSEIALDRSRRTSDNGYYQRHRTEQYFEPKIYQDLLATAVLNKIVDKQLNIRQSVSERDIGGGGDGCDDINDNIRPASCDENFSIEKLSTSSGSSVEPQSDCSYPEAEQILNNNNDKSYDLRLNSDRDSVMSDYLANHMIPLPDLSAMANESEEDDYTSVTSSAVGDGTWEKNWLFKKKKSTISTSITTSSIGMLVPDPKEDVRAQIGDKTADEVSDLSELGSDSDDSLNSLRSQLDPINDRLVNKHLIGGQNSKMILDELIECSSMVSNTLPSEVEPIYTDACNEDIVDATTKNEAINENVSQQKPEQKTEYPKESEDLNSNSITASDDNSDFDGCTGFSTIEIIESTSRTPSVVEILAAMALGPMLAVPSVDQPAAMAVSDLNAFTELKELALAEIKSRALELTPSNLDVIPEEPGDVGNQTENIISSKNISVSEEINFHLHKSNECYQSSMPKESMEPDASKNNTFSEFCPKLPSNYTTDESVETITKNIELAALDQEIQGTRMEETALIGGIAKSQYESSELTSGQPNPDINAKSSEGNIDENETCATISKDPTEHSATKGSSTNNASIEGQHPIIQSDSFSNQEKENLKTEQHLTIVDGTKSKDQAHETQAETRRTSPKDQSSSTQTTSDFTSNEQSSETQIQETPSDENSFEAWTKQTETVSVDQSARASDAGTLNECAFAEYPKVIGEIEFTLEEHPRDNDQIEIGVISEKKSDIAANEVKSKKYPLEEQPTKVDEIIPRVEPFEIQAEQRKTISEENSDSTNNESKSKEYYIREQPTGIDTIISKEQPFGTQVLQSEMIHEYRPDSAECAESQLEEQPTEIDEIVSKEQPLEAQAEQSETVSDKKLEYFYNEAQSKEHTLEEQPIEGDETASKEKFFGTLVIQSTKISDEKSDPIDNEAKYEECPLEEQPTTVDEIISKEQPLRTQAEQIETISEENSDSANNKYKPEEHSLREQQLGIEVISSKEQPFQIQAEQSEACAEEKSDSIRVRFEEPPLEEQPTEVDEIIPKEHLFERHANQTEMICAEKSDSVNDEANSEENILREEANGLNEIISKEQTFRKQVSQSETTPEYKSDFAIDTAKYEEIPLRKQPTAVDKMTSNEESIATHAEQSATSSVEKSNPSNNDDKYKECLLENQTTRVDETISKEPFGAHVARTDTISEEKSSTSTSKSDALEEQSTGIDEIVSKQQSVKTQSEQSEMSSEEKSMSNTTDDKFKERTLEPNTVDVTTSKEQSIETHTDHSKTISDKKLDSIYNEYQSKECAQEDQLPENDEIIFKGQAFRAQMEPTETVSGDKSESTNTTLEEQQTGIDKIISKEEPLGTQAAQTEIITRNKLDSANSEECSLGEQKIGAEEIISKEQTFGTQVEPSATIFYKKSDCTNNEDKSEEQTIENEEIIFEAQVELSVTITGEKSESAGVKAEFEECPLEEELRQLKDIIPNEQLSGMQAVQTEMISNENSDFINNEDKLDQCTLKKQPNKASEISSKKHPFEKESDSDSIGAKSEENLTTVVDKITFKEKSIETQADHIETTSDEKFDSTCNEALSKECNLQEKLAENDEIISKEQVFEAQIAQSETISEGDSHSAVTALEGVFDEIISKEQRIETKAEQREMIYNKFEEYVLEEQATVVDKTISREEFLGTKTPQTETIYEKSSESTNNECKFEECCLTEQPTEIDAKILKEQLFGTQVQCDTIHESRRNSATDTDECAESPLEDQPTEVDEMISKEQRFETEAEQRERISGSAYSEAQSKECTLGEKLTKNDEIISKEQALGTKGERSQAISKEKSDSAAFALEEQLTGIDEIISNEKLIASDAEQRDATSGVKSDTASKKANSIQCPLKEQLPAVDAIISEEQSVGTQTEQNEITPEEDLDYAALRDKSQDCPLEDQPVEVDKISSKKLLGIRNEQIKTISNKILVSGSNGAKYDEFTLEKHPTSKDEIISKEPTLGIHDAQTETSSEEKSDSTNNANKSEECTLKEEVTEFDEMVSIRQSFEEQREYLLGEKATGVDEINSTEQPFVTQEGQTEMISADHLGSASNDAKYKECTLKQQSTEVEGRILLHLDKQTEDTETILDKQSGNFLNSDYEHPKFEEHANIQSAAISIEPSTQPNNQNMFDSTIGAASEETKTTGNNMEEQLEEPVKITSEEHVSETQVDKINTVCKNSPISVTNIELKSDSSRCEKYLADIDGESFKERPCEMKSDQDNKIFEEQLDELNLFDNKNFTGRTVSEPKEIVFSESSSENHITIRNTISIHQSAEPAHHNILKSANSTTNEESKTEFRNLEKHSKKLPETASDETQSKQLEHLNIKSTTDSVNTVANEGSEIEGKALEQQSREPEQSSETQMEQTKILNKKSIEIYYKYMFDVANSAISEDSQIADNKLQEHSGELHEMDSKEQSSEEQSPREIDKIPSKEQTSEHQSNLIGGQSNEINITDKADTPNSTTKDVSNTMVIELEQQLTNRDKTVSNEQTVEDLNKQLVELDIQNISDATSSAISEDSEIADIKLEEHSGELDEIVLKEQSSEEQSSREIDKLQSKEQTSKHQSNLIGGQSNEINITDKADTSNSTTDEVSNTIVIELAQQPTNPHKTISNELPVEDLNKQLDELDIQNMLDATNSAISEDSEIADNKLEEHSIELDEIVLNEQSSEEQQLCEINIIDTAHTLKSTSSEMSKAVDIKLEQQPINPDKTICNELPFEHLSKQLVELEIQNMLDATNSAISEDSEIADNKLEEHSRELDKIALNEQSSEEQLNLIDKISKEQLSEINIIDKTYTPKSTSSEISKAVDIKLEQQRTNPDKTISNEQTVEDLNKQLVELDIQNISDATSSAISEDSEIADIKLEEHSRELDEIVLKEQGSEEQSSREIDKLPSKEQTSEHQSNLIGGQSNEINITDKADTPNSTTKEISNTMVIELEQQPTNPDKTISNKLPVEDLNKQLVELDIQNISDATNSAISEDSEIANIKLEEHSRELDEIVLREQGSEEQSSREIDKLPSKEQTSEHQSNLIGGQKNEINITDKAGTPNSTTKEVSNTMVIELEQPVEDLNKQLVELDIQNMLDANSKLEVHSRELDEIVLKEQSSEEQSSREIDKLPSKEQTSEHQSNLIGGQLNEINITDKAGTPNSTTKEVSNTMVIELEQQPTNPDKTISNELPVEDLNKQLVELDIQNMLDADSKLEEHSIELDKIALKERGSEEQELPEINIIHTTDTLKSTSSEMSKAVDIKLEQQPTNPDKILSNELPVKDLSKQLVELDIQNMLDATNSAISEDSEVADNKLEEHSIELDKIALNEQSSEEQLNLIDRISKEQLSEINIIDNTFTPKSTNIEISKAVDIKLEQQPTNPDKTIYNQQTFEDLNEQLDELDIQTMLDATNSAISEDSEIADNKLEEHSRELDKIALKEQGCEEQVNLIDRIAKEQLSEINIDDKTNTPNSTTDEISNTMVIELEQQPTNPHKTISNELPVEYLNKQLDELDIQTMLVATNSAISEDSEIADNKLEEHSRELDKVALKEQGCEEQVNLIDRIAKEQLSEINIDDKTNTPNSTTGEVSNTMVIELEQQPTNPHKTISNELPVEYLNKKLDELDIQTMLDATNSAISEDSEIADNKLEEHSRELDKIALKEQGCEEQVNLIDRIAKEQLSEINIDDKTNTPNSTTDEVSNTMVIELEQQPTNPHKTISNELPVEYLNKQLDELDIQNMLDATNSAISKDSEIADNKLEEHSRELDKIALKEQGCEEQVNLIDRIAKEQLSEINIDDKTNTPNSTTDEVSNTMVIELEQQPTNPHKTISNELPVEYLNKQLDELDIQNMLDATNSAISEDSEIADNKLEEHSIELDEIVLNEQGSEEQQLSEINIIDTADTLKSTSSEMSKAVDIKLEQQPTNPDKTISNELPVEDLNKQLDELDIQNILDATNSAISEDSEIADNKIEEHSREIDKIALKEQSSEEQLNLIDRISKEQLSEINITDKADTPNSTTNEVSKTMHIKLEQQPTNPDKTISNKPSAETHIEKINIILDKPLIELDLQNVLESANSAISEEMILEKNNLQNEIYELGRITSKEHASQTLVQQTDGDSNQLVKSNLDEPPMRTHSEPKLNPVSEYKNMIPKADVHDILTKSSTLDNFEDQMSLEYTPPVTRQNTVVEIQTSSNREEEKQTADQLSYDSNPNDGSRTGTEEYIENCSDERDILAIIPNNKSTTNTILTANTNTSSETNCKANTNSTINHNRKRPVTYEYSPPTPSNQRHPVNQLLTSAVKIKDARRLRNDFKKSKDDDNDVADSDDNDINKDEGDDDDDVVAILRHFVPGSIAEREYKKWYNAVEMPNNPYAPEALKRRISGSQERFIDLPNISPTKDLNPLDLLSEPNLDVDKNMKLENEYKRYSRDYYINSSLTAPQASMAKDLSAAPVAEDNRETTKKTPSCGDRKSEIDLYKAIPAQVVDDSFCFMKTTSPTSVAAIASLQSTSDDSDTIKATEPLKVHETNIPAIKDVEMGHRVQGTVDEIDSAEKHYSSLSAKRSESCGNVATATRGSTPVAFKFLQPKRKLLEPNQLLTANEEGPQDASSQFEKAVIEEDVVKALPSVKALARAFLMTTNTTEPQKLWLRKAKTLSEGEKKRNTSPKRSVDHLMQCNRLKPEDDVTITSDLSSLETDSSSVGTEITTTSDPIPPAVSDTSTVGNISPVPVRQGVLKNNIAFFENLKNK